MPKGFFYSDILDESISHIRGDWFISLSIIIFFSHFAHLSIKTV